MKTEKLAGGILVNGQFLSMEKRLNGAIRDYKKWLEKQEEKQKLRFAGLTLQEALDAKKRLYEKLKKGEITQEEVKNWRKNHCI